MTNKNTFKILTLIARPAAGKSELIDFLRHIEPDIRRELYHICKLEEIDDFPMLWVWFEEDQILTKMGHARLYPDENGHFVGHHLWDLLIERICLEYEKIIRENGNYHDDFTTIIEFSRGSQHGGYARAFDHLSVEIIKEYGCNIY